MTHDGSALIMNCGRDIEVAFGQGADAKVRLDEHGWLGLSGEAGSADLNMAAVTRNASPSLVHDYIGEIRDRGLDAGIAHYLERGATTFTLEATEAGFHLYEQVGFVTVATPSVFVTAASTQFPG